MNSHPVRSVDQTSSTKSTNRDAWWLWLMAFPMYAITSTVLQKFSIVGATMVAQLLWFLLAAVVFVKLKCGNVVEGLRLKPVSRGVLVRVIGLVITSYGVLTLLEQLMKPIVESWLSRYSQMAEAITQVIAPKSSGEWVLNLAVVGLIGPICEEVFFRGAFQGTLVKRGRWMAISMAALVFASSHLNPVWFVGILFMGVVLGWITECTQSIVPAMIWHVLHNSLAVMVSGLTAGQPSSSAMPVWLAGLLAVGFVLALVEFARYTRQTVEAVPGCLAGAPDLCGNRAQNWIRGVGIALVVLFGGTLSCYGTATMAEEVKVSNLRKGDLIFYARKLVMKWQPVVEGDSVVVQAEKNRLNVCRVVAVQGDRLRVIRRNELNSSDQEMEVVRDQVVGKIVSKVDLGDEMKQMLETLRTHR